MKVQKKNEHIASMPNDVREMTDEVLLNTLRANVQTFTTGTPYHKATISRDIGDQFHELARRLDAPCAKVERLEAEAKVMQDLCEAGLGIADRGNPTDYEMWRWKLDAYRAMKGGSDA